jgi:ferredoxin
MEFQSEVWKQWGKQCLACGTCANVCPTCYCYGVEETVNIDLKTAKKTKSLYSCNLIDFAEVAGGHNFRPEQHIRLKYRYYHKHRGFVEAYEESLCVLAGLWRIVLQAWVPEVCKHTQAGGLMDTKLKFNDIKTEDHWKSYAEMTLRHLNSPTSQKSEHTPAY